MGVVGAALMGSCWAHAAQDDPAPPAVKTPPQGGKADLPAPPHTDGPGLGDFFHMTGP